MVRSRGCLIAIDDFGAGFSNFEQILALKPNILKIDGSLIKDIDHDAIHYAIVENIHHLAKKLGIATVAEYVHSEAILSKVRIIGIDYVQGFHLDIPKPFKDFEKVIV
jgi:EAL domain-containing protein (putative c-di-GMP-specific phosphodiesterase class I)